MFVKAQNLMEKHIVRSPLRPHTNRYNQSADIIARVHKLPALGECGVCLAWKRGLGEFFPGFLPFSPTTNLITPFRHAYLIDLI